MLLGAVIGCAIAIASLLLLAAMVRWLVLMRLWPNLSIIGAAFGAAIALAQQRPAGPDLRYGECPITGKPLQLL